MKNCTYTAQGFLNCPVENKNKPHYSTLGFDRDVQAGVFIEPFQEQQSRPENFAIRAPETVPVWASKGSSGQFATQCTGCTIADKNSCKAGVCPMQCSCNRCVDGKIQQKTIIGNIVLKGPELFYCGGSDYSKIACTSDQLTQLKCQQAVATEETSTAAETTKSSFYQRQRFTNSPYNMAQ